MTSTNFDPRILKAPHPVPGAPDNWKRFFSINTDAKVIGIQYIATSMLFLLVGGLLAMIVRGELITPEADLVDPTVYNGLYTMHGTVMLFLFLFPVLNGLNNLLIPTMIGAPDMAFPKLNAAAFWLVPVFAVLLMASFFCPRGTSTSRLVVLSPGEHSEPAGSLLQWSAAVAVGCGFVGNLIDLWCHQFRHHDHPHACPWHGLFQDASLLLDGVGRANHSADWPSCAHRRRDHAAV
jgi:cytochrome c oxidase subunit 1